MNVPDPKLPLVGIPVEQTGPPPAGPTAPATNEAIAGKLSAWGTHGSRAAGSAVRHLEEQDHLMMSADAARMAGDAIRQKAGQSALGGGGELVVAFAMLKRGELHQAAYHLGKSLESFSARLRDSRAVGVANAVVLATSPDRLREAHTQLKQSTEATLDGAADAPDRAKAGLALASTGWQLAYVYQTLGTAAHSVARIGIDRLGRVAALAPAAAGARNALARLALTPVGKAAAAFSKWVPLLNIVGVAVSAKTAIDVKRDARSSGATLALAGGSLALAGAGLWAAVALGFWPFLGLTAVGIGVDVALMKSWQRDRDRAAAAPIAETAGSREIVAAE